MHRFPIVSAAAALLFAASSISLAAAPTCQLTFRLGTSTPLSTASVFVIYQNAPGDFPGDSTSVSCQLLNNTLGQISDADQTRTLTIVMIGTPTSIKGPKDVARCTFTPTNRFPVPGDFNLSGQSGFDTSLPFPNQVNANITISDIDCSGTIATTTTSTSTTTLPGNDYCGDFDGNGIIQVSDALNVLRGVVGQQPCDLCVCDVDGSGSKGAADALIVLKTAVGILIELGCPVCQN